MPPVGPIIRILLSNFWFPRRETTEIRSETLAGKPPKRGGILTALLRSSLVGAELEISRSREEGREIEL
ncbi:hypothetical protein QE435_000670 [Rhizobium sp. SORGH_AS 787]|nr:hypothetical protein [Rhizobium sp. SORGH_AS_0787]